MSVCWYRFASRSRVNFFVIIVIIQGHCLILKFWKDPFPEEFRQSGPFKPGYFLGLFFLFFAISYRMNSFWKISHQIFGEFSRQISSKTSHRYSFDLFYKFFRLFISIIFEAISQDFTCLYFFNYLINLVVLAVINFVSYNFEVNSSLILMS